MTKRLYKTVADALLNKIDTGVYMVGDRLPAERDLAARYNVSRPTMREAVIALEVAGRVEVRKGSGVYVIKPPAKETPGSLDLDVGPFELTEARLLIEGEAAALAATLITEAEIEELEAIIERMIAENDTGEGGERADKEFHMLIARATRNSAIVGIVEELWNMRENSKLTKTMYATVRQEGITPSIAEHWAIHDALKTGVAAKARSAMRMHLSRVVDTMFTATEIQAVENVKRKINADRERFGHLIPNS